MTDHSELLPRYKRIREVRFRLNNLLATKIPKETMDECARILGMFHKGALVFDSEAELPLLLDYCIYYPQRDGRNLVAKYLEQSPPPADSVEMRALRAMTAAYYSVFQVTDTEPGVGFSVQDLLRDEPGFIVDVGLGTTLRRHMMIASRIIPMDGLLMTGGAGLPLDSSAATRVFHELSRTKQSPQDLDYHRISPRREAEIAALIIRACRATGMSSRVAYVEPGGASGPAPSDPGPRSDRRNIPCPCGSGKKYRACCGRR